MGGSQMYWSEWKKPDTKERIVHSSFYIKFYNQESWYIVIEIHSVVASRGGGRNDWGRGTKGNLSWLMEKLVEVWVMWVYELIKT